MHHHADPSCYSHKHFLLWKTKIPYTQYHAIHYSAKMVLVIIHIAENKFFFLLALIVVWQGNKWSQVWVRALIVTIWLPYSCTWGPVRLHPPPLHSPLTGGVKAAQCFVDLAADYRESGIMRFDEEMRHTAETQPRATASPYTEKSAEISWALSQVDPCTSF